MPEAGLTSILIKYTDSHVRELTFSSDQKAIMEMKTRFADGQKSLTNLKES